MNFYKQYKAISQKHNQELTELWANATDKDLEDYVWGLIGDEPPEVGGTFQEELEHAKKNREYYQKVNQRQNPSA